MASSSNLALAPLSLSPNLLYSPRRRRSKSPFLCSYSPISNQKLRENPISHSLSRASAIAFITASLFLVDPAIAFRGGGPYGQEVTRGQDLTAKDFSAKSLIKQDFKTLNLWIKQGFGKNFINRVNPTTENATRETLLCNLRFETATDSVGHFLMYTQSYMLMRQNVYSFCWVPE